MDLLGLGLLILTIVPIPLPFRYDKIQSTISHEKQAFTLVELLVVITIIGILVRLLLPAPYKSKSMAKRIHCVNNVRQMSLVLDFYADDNSRRLIQLWDYRYKNYQWTKGSIKPWNRLIWESGYLEGNTNILQCASNTRRADLG